MKLSASVFASVFAICCLSCSIKTDDTSIHTDEFNDWKKAAEQGDALAQTMLGSIYANGDFGVPKDDTEAVKWWRKAAEQGNDNAVQIHGGMGLAKEMPLERWYRELRTRRIGEGPSEVHRMVISRELFG